MLLPNRQRIYTIIEKSWKRYLKLKPRFGLRKGAKKINLLDNSSVMFMCFVDVRIPEEDLKKAETCRGIRVGLSSILVQLMVLYIK
jgi:hypothetical protein